MLDLQFLGITTLLVLRGDKAKDESSFVPEKAVSYTHLTSLVLEVMLKIVLLLETNQQTDIERASRCQSLSLIHI